MPGPSRAGATAGSYGTPLAKAPVRSLHTVGTIRARTSSVPGTATHARHTDAMRQTRLPHRPNTAPTRAPHGPHTAPTQTHRVIAERGSYRLRIACERAIRAKLCVISGLGQFRLDCPIPIDRDCAARIGCVSGAGTSLAIRSVMQNSNGRITHVTFEWSDGPSYHEVEPHRNWRIAVARAISTEVKNTFLRADISLLGIRTHRGVEDTGTVTPWDDTLIDLFT